METGASLANTILRRSRVTTWDLKHSHVYAFLTNLVWSAQLILPRQILEVCYKAGVKVVTIYAFSIENFKRSKHEVNALMEMAKTKLGQLAEHGALLDRYGASIRILGNRDLVKPDVIEAIDRAVSITAHNKK